MPQYERSPWGALRSTRQGSRRYVPVMVYHSRAVVFFPFWQAKLHVHWPLLCGDKKSGAVTHVTLAAKPREISKANQIRSCECPCIRVEYTR